MSDRKAKLRQIIAADHAAAMAVFQQLTPEQWEQPVPSDEGVNWKARDVLAHLAVSESGQLYQLNQAIKGEQTMPPDFDLNRFNRRSVEKNAARTTADFLKQLETDHAAVLVRLEEVSEADLDRSGRHARGDTLTVEQFFQRITEHRRQHAQELAGHLVL
jgi:hypothetical protein